MYIEPVPNFYVGEEELTRLGISREKEVLFLGGTVSYAFDGEMYTVSFDDEVDDRHASFRMNTALDVNNDMAQDLINRSLNRLELIRGTAQPNAAAIIFTKSKLHARQTADYIKNTRGYDAVIIDDDVTDPTKVMADFQNGKQRVIIAIRMLLEGVNIKRTRVITHLTNISTRMSVVQMWTRGSRKENLSQTGPTYVFCLKDPGLVNIAESMDSVIIRQLMADDVKDERMVTSAGSTAKIDGSFQPVSAIAGEMVAVFRGQHTTAEELRLAEEYRALNPQMSSGLSDTQIAHIAKSFGVVVEAEKVTEAPPETYDDINQRLKRESNKLANKIAQRRDVHPKEVHREWISSGGARHEDASNEQLQLKVAWLAKVLGQLDPSVSALS